MAADGGCESDVVHIMNEGFKEWGVLKSMLSNRGMGINVTKSLFEGVIAKTAWGMRSGERRKGNVLEMKCWTRLVGLSRMDRVRNEKVRKS